MDERSRLVAFMRSCRYAVISSTNARSMPESALVGIAVTQELAVIFDTSKTSRKYGNLKTRPACSLVMGWEGEQTVQYEGSAWEPEGDELEGYRREYFAVWPDGVERMAWPEIAYFVVMPAWIRFSDYAASPPLIREFEL